MSHMLLYGCQAVLMEALRLLRRSGRTRWRADSKSSRAKWTPDAESGVVCRDSDTADQVDAGTATTIPWSEARRRSTRSRPDPRVEYLEELSRKQKPAARWYAERSVTAAAGFSDEVDAAESGDPRLPEAWPPYDHGTRRTCFNAFRSALSIESKLAAS